MGTNHTIKRNIFIFDVDGTLMDSRAGLQESMLAAIDSLGIERPPLERVQAALGGASFRSGILSLVSLTEEQYQKANRVYGQTFSERGYLLETAYDGVVEWIAALHQKGARIFACSMRPKQFSLPSLERDGLLPFIEDVWGPDFDQGRVHKHQVLAYRMQKLGIVPQEAVMIGDRNFDIIAGKAVGAATLAVRYGYAQPGELEAEHPDAIVDTVEQAKQWTLQALSPHAE